MFTKASRLYTAAILRRIHAQVPPKATVITEAELAQMKRRAVITSLADEEAARVEREKTLEVWMSPCSPPL